MLKRFFSHIGLLLWVLSLVFSSCQSEELVEPMGFPDLMAIPYGFPEIMYPEDNEFSKLRWDLGKKLFYDPIMSVDSSISCAGCHKASIAFSDEVAFSPGVFERPGVRNSPSLANVAFQPYFTREGGVPSLEMQVLVPLQEHNEFAFNIVLLAERLKSIPEYVQMAKSAYGREPDAFVIARSIACFERSLISGNSRYDRHLNPEDEMVLNESEARGMQLFYSDRTNCSSCHNGFNFTNYAFENNGLYLDYPDSGRYRLTSNEDDLARFKVPTLRNIEVTAPYMHDGSLATLESVIEHYNSGGVDHRNKSSLVGALNLSDDEKKDLIEFLKSLTDQAFLENPLFKN